jgi:hypothetical protein
MFTAYIKKLNGEDLGVFIWLNNVSAVLSVPVEPYRIKLAVGK